MAGTSAPLKQIKRMTRLILAVFGGAIGAQAKELEELANIIENVCHAVTGFNLEQARKQLLGGKNDE